MSAIPRPIKRQTIIPRPNELSDAEYEEFSLRANAVLEVAGHGPGIAGGPVLIAALVAYILARSDSHQDAHDGIYTAYVEGDKAVCSTWDDGSARH